MQQTLDTNLSNFSLSTTDRLGTTLVGSVLAHAMLILGIGFAVPDIVPDLRVLPTLDIVLVNSRTDSAPDDVQFLAQANQDGGGDSDKSSRPSTPLPLSSGHTGKPQRAEDEMRTGSVDTPRVPAPSLIRGETRDDALPDPSSSQSETVLSEQQAAEALMTERNQLTAELSQFWEQYQQRPRHKFLSARTREYKYAEYMERWRAKVETVGNINYPAAARQRRLAGSLVLDVALNADGSIHGISLERSSGIAVLDAAAQEIVRLAAPYDAFPANIEKEIDILHITRTWEFSQRNTLSSR